MEQEIANNQKVFNILKNELQHLRERPAKKQKYNVRRNRDTSKEAASSGSQNGNAHAEKSGVPSGSQNGSNARAEYHRRDERPLSRICIQELCSSKKKLCELSSMELGYVIGKMDEKYFEVVQKYKTTLTARTRIEVLVDTLFPKNMRRPNSYKECMIIILKSGTPQSWELYNEVMLLYGSNNPEMSIELFAQAVEKLFGETSRVGAHNVMDWVILETFRHAPIEKIYDILDAFHVPHDTIYVNALRVIGMTLSLPKESDAYNSTLNEYKCMEIRPSTKKESMTTTFNQKITKEDVIAFFPTTGTKIEDVNLDDKDEKTKNIRSILVNFEDPNTAVIAFNENCVWMKQTKTRLKIVRCVQPSSQLPDSSNQPASS